jgi:preprotein translocase subunit SecF
MEFFKPGRVFDFMGQRLFWIPLSFILVIGSIILTFYPGPNYGTDFKGGTEVEIAFTKPVTRRRSAGVEESGFQNPDVVQVTDANNPYHFLVRVQDVSAITETEKVALKQALCYADDSQAPINDETRCPRLR